MKKGRREGVKADRKTGWKERKMEQTSGRKEGREEGMSCSELCIIQIRNEMQRHSRTYNQIERLVCRTKASMVDHRAFGSNRFISASYNPSLSNT